MPSASVLAEHVTRYDLFDLGSRVDLHLSSIVGVDRNPNIGPATDHTGGQLLSERSALGGQRRRLRPLAASEAGRTPALSREGALPPRDVEASWTG